MLKKSENNQQKIQSIVDSFADGLTPPENLDLADYSDKYRILPQISSSERGPWRTSRFPFLREIMHELSPASPTQQIVVMKGAQLGFTEVALNWMFYTIDHSPSPMLYVQKTIEAVERFSKQRFGPSCEEMTRINEILGGPIKVRDSSNTIRIKSFPGGIIILGGANSAASLRSMPIERLVLDEEDSYDIEIQEEGSPSDLAIRRTANFPRRKIYRPSTPGIKELSVTEPLFLKGDRRRFFVPCPMCGEFQVIFWRMIRWDDGDPSSVRMVCDFCKKELTEKYKTYLLENGEWRKECPGREIASFHISSLYSPLGFYSWKDAVTDFVEAESTFNRSKLKVFINTVLGETWSEMQNRVEPHGLIKRKEKYVTEVPQGVVLLTAGVDVQDDRVECEIVGWGRHEENWSVSYDIFTGDTERAFVWELLDEHLQKIWLHESGVEMRVACTAVDSGFRAKVVYEFCKTKEFRRIFPTKGDDGWGHGYILRPKKRIEGILLYHIYVDEVKSKVYSQLQIEKPGSGYCHFPDKEIYDKRYFSGLTAENLKTGKKGGRSILKWDLPVGRRNEPLDARAYAYGARYIIGVDLNKFPEAQRPITGTVRKLIRKKKVIVHSRGY
jgi:phage terminase large subunit GpA-like protein